MTDEPAHNGNGALPAAGEAEYANRLEMLDEAVEHVLLQLIESDFILTGPNGGVTRWGDRAKLLFGWETQRIVGSSLFETVLADVDEGPVRRWEGFLADREGDPPPARFAVQARHCDGPEFPLELTFVPVKLSQGSEFSFFVRDLTADLPSGAKLARLRRDHKEVLQSISSALSNGTPLEPDERLAGVLVAYAATGPTPWVDAARREAEEAAAALAEVAEAGEQGGEQAAADRLARTLAQAKRAERSVDEVNAEREALQEQLERESAAMREELDDARRKADEADEHAQRAQANADQANDDAAQALKMARDLERRTQEVRGQLNQARVDSGESTERVAALERAAEGAVERLAHLEEQAREEVERSSRLDKLEADAKGLRDALEESQREAGPVEDPVARAEAQRLSERLDEALAEAIAARTSDEERPRPDEVEAALEQLAQVRAQAEELERALRSDNAQLEEVRESARAAGSEAAGARAAAEEARAEASRSAEEAAHAREELSQVRLDLVAAKSEVGEAKQELADLRAIAAGVREEAEATRAESQAAMRAGEEARAIADKARAEAEAAGDSGRAAGEQGERALQLLGDASEQAGTAAERSEQITARLAELDAEVKRYNTEHTAAHEELSALRRETEDTLRLLERTVGRALSGGGFDAPAPAAGAPAPAPEPQPESEPEPEADPVSTREPRVGFDDAAVPMAVIDLEGRFRELNPVFCDLVGYTEAEFRTAIWPSSLSDDNTRKEHRELRGRLASGELDESPLETCYLHKEGLLVPVSGTVTVVRGEDGSPDHLVLKGAAERAPVSA